MKARWLAALPLLLLISCSGYQRDFHRATQEFQQNQSPKGPWNGTWKSEVNGHHGPLWCLVSQDPNSQQTWHFRYRAGWGLLKFGDYTHRVTTSLRPNGSLPLNASMTLPSNLGTYTVKGQITPTEFTVRYEGNHDKGTMTLTRPQNP